MVADDAVLQQAAWFEARRKAPGRQRIHLFRMDDGVYMSKCREVGTTLREGLVATQGYTGYNRPCIACQPELAAWMPPKGDVPGSQSEPHEPEPTPVPGPETVAMSVPEPEPQPEPVDHAKVVEARRAAVLDALRAAAKPMTATQVGQAANLSHLAAAQCLEELARRGEAHVLNGSDSAGKLWQPGAGTAKQAAATKAKASEDAPHLVQVVERPVVQPKALQRYTFQWLPLHMSHHKACFESSVLAWDADEARRFLVDAHQPAKIYIHDVRIEAA